MSLKLNLGCGKYIHQGYINIDLHNPKADIVHDLTTPLPYETASVDGILAEHIIEHFDRRDWPGVLRDWVRVLKCGGKLIIISPDILRCATYLLSNYKSKNWLLAIYGAGSGYANIHKNGFSLVKTIKELDGVGIDVISHGYLMDRKPAPDGFNFSIEGIKRCN